MKQHLILTIFTAATLLVSLPQAFAQNTMPDETSREQVVDQPSDEVLEAAEYIQSMEFKKAPLNERMISTLNTNYSYVDPKGLIPSALLASALSYFEANQGKIGNKNYLSVVDFSANSSKTRFFIINMSTGAVEAIHVAHGSGSDANNDGYADKFSNVSGSNASSLGYYLTAETYNGKHGLSLRLDGLSTTNSNVRKRDIVIHGASYVSDSNVKAGRSWGCLAVSMANRTSVVNMLKGGSLIYAGLSK